MYIYVYIEWVFPKRKYPLRNTTCERGGIDFKRNPNAALSIFLIGVDDEKLDKAIFGMSRFLQFISDIVSKTQISIVTEKTEDIIRKIRCILQDTVVGLGITTSRKRKDDVI